jgi:hypothetical protein
VNLCELPIAGIGHLALGRLEIETDLLEVVQYRPSMSWRRIAFFIEQKSGPNLEWPLQL